MQRYLESPYKCSRDADRPERSQPDSRKRLRNTSSIDYPLPLICFAHYPASHKRKRLTNSAAKQYYDSKIDNEH